MFTPIEGFVGGILIAMAAGATFALSGRTMGVSGISAGLITHLLYVPDTPWNLAFVFGVMSGAKYMLMNNDIFGAFDTSVRLLPSSTAMFAGFLVGFGAQTGNGCTSGHSICGLARMAPRSIFYTPVYMAAGFAVANSVKSSADVANFSGDAWPAQMMSGEKLSASLMLVAFSAALLLGMYAMARLPFIQDSVAVKFGADVLSSFLTGTVFSFGLALAGMTRPSKVLAFLSLGDMRIWDPSLMLVMGGGIGLTMLIFNSANKAQSSKSLLGKGMPKVVNTTIDVQLAAGGILFGMGWGLGGVCPGPLIANLVTMEPQVLKVFLGFVLGLVSFKLVGFSNHLVQVYYSDAAAKAPTPKKAYNEIKIN